MAHTLAWHARLSGTRARPVRAQAEYAAWCKVLVVRDGVNAALEQARGAKAIGSGLDARVTLHCADPGLAAALAALQASSNAVDDLKYLFIVSQVGGARRGWHMRCWGVGACTGLHVSGMRKVVGAPAALRAWDRPNSMCCRWGTTAGPFVSARPTSHLCIDCTTHLCRIDLHQLQSGGEGGWRRDTARGLNPHLVNLTPLRTHPCLPWLPLHRWSLWGMLLQQESTAPTRSGPLLIPHPPPPAPSQVELVGDAAAAKSAAFSEVVPASTPTQGSGGSTNGPELGGDVTGEQRPFLIKQLGWVGSWLRETSD